MCNSAATEAIHIDLNKFNQEFTQEPDEIGYSQIPDGDYHVQVLDVQLGETQTALPKLEWEFKVLGPGHVGKRLWKISVITRKTLHFIGQDLLTCGLKLERFSDLPKRLAGLRGLNLDISKRLNGQFENIYFKNCLNLPQFNVVPFEEDYPY